MDFWSVVGYFIWVYIIITFIGILLGLVFDVFRDATLNGWAKAAWVVFLIALPVVASVVYIVARGGSMSERQFEYARGVRVQGGSAADQVQVSPQSPSDEIVKAKALLDAGYLTRPEFETLKAKALGTAAGQA